MNFTGIKKIVYEDLPDWAKAAVDNGELTLCTPYRYRHCHKENKILLESVGGVPVRQIVSKQSHNAPTVMSDIDTYKAVAIDQRTGKPPVITSRSRHREFLKANNYIEVGNEQPKVNREVKGDFNVRKELERVTRQVMNDSRHHA
jgi:hypothetical protein